MTARLVSGTPSTLEKRDKQFILSPRQTPQSEFRAALLGRC